MKKSYLIVICIILMTLLSLTACSAADINDMQTDNDESEIISTNSDSSGDTVEEPMDGSLQNDELLSSNADGDSENLISKNDENILNDGETGDFSELADLIDSNSVINLTKNYINTNNYIASGGYSISIKDASKTIEGNGHIIDLNQYGAMKFYASRGGSADVTLKNIIFKNGKYKILEFGDNPGDGAINLKIINCSFENDQPSTATKKEGAISYKNIKNGEVLIKNCNFTNNAGVNGIPFFAAGSAKFTFDNCLFKNNKINTVASDYRGGLLTFFTCIQELNIYNCRFENNTIVNSVYDKDGRVTTTYDRDYLHAGGLVYVTVATNKVKVNVVNTTFIDATNKDGNGAAMYFGPTPGSGELKNFDFDVKIDNTSFINCNAGHYGGAIYVTGYDGLSHNTNTPVDYHFKMDISNQSSFVNCSAASGGAVFFDAPWFTGKTTCDVDLNIHDNVLFENNHVKAPNGGNLGGGAIYVGYSKSGDVSPADIETYTINVTLSKNVSFINNSAEVYASRNCGGGAIYVFTHATLDIDNCSFSNNSVKVSNNANNQDVGGGAIYVGKPNDQNEQLTSSLSINNTSFNNNTVEGRKGSGGAIYVKDVSYNNITDTVFDGNGVNANSGSAVYFENTCSNNLNNVTFSNNVASGNAVGGALSFNNDASNVISNCNFLNNSITSNKGNGGAIYYKDGAGQGENTYSNTTFEGNTATNGGAVYVGSGWKDIDFSDTNFTNNSAYAGGAIYLYQSSAILNNTNLNANKANKSGGAVYARNATLDVDNSNFNDNNANKSGGALYVCGNRSTLTVEDTDFINNSATNLYGGAMFAGIGTNTSVDHCNFYNNSAYEGSAINYQGKTGDKQNHSISNSQFIDNLAESIILDAALDKYSDPKRLDVVYSGGDNYLNAIKSYDDLEFDNVTYYEYNQGIKNTDDEDYKKSYLIPYQTIHVKYLDENGNVIGTEDLITDENGKATTNPPSGAVYVHVFRDGDSYYTKVSSDLDSRLGDFDIIQNRIFGTANGGTLILERDFVYTIGLDHITEGIIIDRPITIDGRGWSIDALFKSRVFQILSDNVTFTNITFLNSTNWDGSFIYGNGVKNIKIENCTFKNPSDIDKIINPGNDNLDEDDDIITIPAHSFDGGAVYITGNNTLTNDSKFINLIAYHGGAMYLNGTNHTIKNSYYNYTHAMVSGGGVYAIGMNFSIENCEFENCLAFINDTEETPINGGGAVFFEGENLNITNSNFTNCTTKLFGGAVYSNGNNTKISASNFTSSKALTGGAVFFDINAIKSSIDNSIFFNNTAAINGGAVSWYAEEGIINNSQFKNNTQFSSVSDKANGGGAIFWNANSGKIYKSNFTDNRVAFPFINPYYDPEWDYGYIQKYLDFDIYDMENLINLFKDYSKGGAFLITGTDVLISECIFDQNYAQSGGAIAIEVTQSPITQGDGYYTFDKYGNLVWVGDPVVELPNVVIVNSTFIDNFAQYGGAVIVDNTQQSTITQNILTECKFYNNTAYIAGALYLAADSCNVEKSVFENNTAFIGGAISEGCYAQVEMCFGGLCQINTMVVGNKNWVLNSTFKNNFANHGGAVFWLGSEGKITDNCKFIENKYADSFDRYAQGLYDCYKMNIIASDYYQIIGFEVYGSEKLIQKVGDDLFEGAGGAIYWMGANGLIESVEFTQNTAYCGGAVFAIDLNGISDEYAPLLAIAVCNFTNNSASSGGAVSFLGGYGGIYESEFINNTASPTELASEYSSTVSLVEGNNGGAVFLRSQTAYIIESHFINNTAGSGGAISLKQHSVNEDIIFDNYQSQIQMCTFNNNSADIGGAIYNEANNAVFGAEFINNSAKIGGALYNEATGVFIISLFSNNTALEKGGAIYNKGNDMEISESLFTFNKADMGSAVFDSSNGISVYDSNFTDNKASAASIIITSCEVQDKNVIISAKFKGNDNLINALYVMTKSNFINVEYWGAEGLTNTDIDDPAVSDAEAGQNITFELIDNADSTNMQSVVNMTNWNGQAFVTLPNVKSGRYYVIVSHFDDNYYTEINTLKMINVGKVESPIAIEIEDISYKQNATAEIKLNRDVTGNLTILIDGKYNTTVDLTGKNGVVTLENISGLNAGPHNITVIYSGNENYDKSNKTAKFNVKSISSRINITTDGGNFKDNITVNITVENDATGKVIVTIQDKFGATLIINDTNELQTIVNNLNAGEYNITAYYTGDNNYLPNSNQTVLIVKQIDLNPTVTATDVTINENTTFTITVPDDFVGYVNITVDRVSEVYNIAGSTQITFVNLPAGNKTASVKFYGDNNYYNITVYPVNFTVTEKEKTEELPTITVNIPDTTYPQSTTAQVNVSGNFNGTAVITVDERNFTLTVTNGTGTVVIDNLSAGIKTATVNFTSTDKQVNLTSVTKFAINKAASKIDVKAEGRDVIVNVTVGATGDVAFYVNGEKQIIQLNNSQAVWKNILTIGNNTIVVVYEGCVNYTESENNTDVYVNKLDSLVNVTAAETVYGNDAVITVKVPVNQTGYVTITVNNTNYTQQLEHGEAVFHIPGLTVKEYSVDAIYLGNDKYDVKSNTTTFNVTKADLNATVNGFNITVNDNASFIISNVPSDFKGKLNITVDGHTYSDAANSLIIMEKLAKGNKTATAVFWNDSNYNVLTLTCNFTVSDVPAAATKINITVEDVTYPSKATANITVSGNANGTITVSVDGKVLPAVEVKNGTATVDLGVLAAGVKDLKVNFTVSDNVNTNATANTRFTVKKAQSNVNITVEGKNVIATVTTGATGEVTFYVNGEKQIIQINNSKATWKNILDAGNNTIVVVYEGNTNYTESENNTNAYINKTESLIKVTATETVYSNDAVITVTVPANQTGYVTITVNNNNYTQMLKDGVAVFNIPGLNVNEYSVEATYLGNDKYGVKSNTTRFNVTEADLNVDVLAENITVLQNGTFIISHIPDDFKGKVNITVDGITYPRDADSIVNIPTLTSGNKTATIVFYGDKNYKQVTLTANFTVSRIDAAINVEIADVTYPDDAKATITVSGNANGTVIITIDGKEYGTVNIKNGIGEVNLTGLSGGVKQVTAKFTVTDEINSNASTTTKFTVKKAQSQVNITVDNGNVIATVTPGATGNVTFYINGIKQVVGLNNSQATLKNALQIGNNTIIVLYGGDINYTESENNTNFNIPKLESRVNVAAHNIVYGNSTIITVTVPANQTGYVTILVNNENHTMEIKDGKAVFNITGLKVNTYTVNVSYSGDKTYDVNVNSTVFNVTKADLPASVIAENITVIQNSEFIIHVPDDFTGKVNITVDNSNYNGDAKSLIKMDKLAAGDKTAKVVFYDDSNYKDLTLTCNFTVSNLPVIVNITTVNADNMTRGYNSPFDYQAAFLDSEGKALANTEVEFKVDGQSYKVKTNKDGIAQLTASKLDVGVYNITSINLATGEQVTRQLTIVARIIENKDMTMDFSSGKYFKVKVIGDDGNIAPKGEIIDIYANNIHYVAKVDKNGYAKLKINLNPKKYKLVAEYKTYKTTNKLVVKQVLKLVKKTVSVKKGKKVVLKAKLKWSNGKAIKGKKITFKFKGKKYNAKTNSKGIAKVTIKKKVTKKLKKGKKYTYSASFKTNKVNGKIKVK